MLRETAILAETLSPLLWVNEPYCFLKNAPSSTRLCRRGRGGIRALRLWDKRETYSVFELRVWRVDSSSTIHKVFYFYRAEALKVTHVAVVAGHVH